jgi:hypothetical protein
MLTLIPNGTFAISLFYIFSIKDKHKAKSPYTKAER